MIYDDAFLPMYYSRIYILRLISRSLPLRSGHVDDKMFQETGAAVPFPVEILPKQELTRGTSLSCLLTTTPDQPCPQIAKSSTHPGTLRQSLLDISSS
jgi:hypothetical protein